MYTKKIFTLVLYCLMLQGSYVLAAPIPGAQVEELLEWAQQENPQLTASRFAAEAQLQRADSADAWPDPTLRMEWMDVNAASNTRYTVMQTVPFWGKRGLRRAVAEAEARQANGAMLETWAELSARIKIDFAQYYLLHHSAKLIREILVLVDNLERIAQARYATGLAAQQDVIRAQMEQTQLQRDLVMLETEHHHVMTRLNTLLRREPAAPLAEPQHLRPVPPQLLSATGNAQWQLRKNNTQLQVVEAALQAVEKNRELIFKNRYPDFTLGIAPVQAGGQIKEWGLMAEFSIPLQQTARRANERAAEAELGEATARREALISQLTGDLVKEILSLQAAQRLENIARSSLLPQAETTLQAALTGYQTGKVDFATLLDAQRQIFKARLDVLNAQTDAQTSLAKIEKLLGEK